MAKKTFSIRALILLVNARNALSTSSPETRAGWNSMLEEVLHESGYYKGFSYLTADELPPGCPPGIVYAEKFSDNHKYPDPTRIKFLIADSLAND